MLFQCRQPVSYFVADSAERLHFRCGEMVDEYVADVGYVLRSCGLDKIAAPRGDGDDRPPLVGAASLA